MSGINDKSIFDRTQVQSSDEAEQAAPHVKDTTQRKTNDAEVKHVDVQQKALNAWDVYAHGMEALKKGNQQEAFEDFKEAAAQNHDEACFILAEMYRQDPEKQDEAFSLYKKAADQLHPGAQLRMAQILFGEGDFSEAKKYAEQAVAFFKETKDLFFRNATSDVGEAELAVQQENFRQAHLVLGKIYEHESDYEKARQNYEKATSQGSPDSEALKNLGRMYAEGLGVEQDYNKAIDLLLEAYMASGYNQTDGVIDQMNQIVDLLMLQENPLTQVTKESLEKLEKMYSGYDWFLGDIKTLYDDYDTAQNVAEIVSGAKSPTPELVSRKRSLECFYWAHIDEPEKFKSKVESFIYALGFNVPIHDPELYSWIAQIYKEGKKLPSDNLGFFLSLLHQPHLDKADQVLLFKLFPEVNINQEHFLSEWNKGLFSDLGWIIAKHSHPSIAKRFKEVKKEYEERLRIVAYKQFETNLRAESQQLTSALGKLPRESLNIPQEEEERLKRINHQALKNLLGSFEYAEFTDDQIDHLVDLMIQKCPELGIPDSAYDPEALKLVSAQYADQFILKEPAQKEHEERIKYDVESFVASQEDYKGRIPFSALASTEIKGINYTDIDYVLKFLKGEETQAKAGVGSAMNLNNRPQQLLLGQVQSGETYLDIGAGVGSQTYGIIKKGAKVMMNDADAWSLAVFKDTVKELIPEEELQESVEFNYGFFPDSTKDIPDESFDGIVCNHVMHYTNPEQIRSMFAEMFRLLKPGGKLHIDAISPLHGYLFGFAIKQTLEKMQQGEEWPSELKDTGEVFVKETGKKGRKNIAKHLPKYMHPQFPEVLAREASNARFIPVEVGYAPFFSEGAAGEHGARKNIMRALLSNEKMNMQDLVTLPFEDRGISYIMVQKPVLKA